jgi:hypothetical protein
MQFLAATAKHQQRRCFEKYQDVYDSHSIISESMQQQAATPVVARTIIVKEVPIVEQPQINRTYKITKTTTTTHHGLAPPPPPPPLSFDQFNPEQIKQSFAHLQQQAAMHQQQQSRNTSRNAEEFQSSGGSRMYRSSSQFPEQHIQNNGQYQQQQQQQSVKTTNRSSSIPASQRTQFSADDGSLYTTETVTNPNSTTTRFYTTRKYTTSGQGLDQDQHATSQSSILRSTPASPRHHTIESRSVVTEEYQNQLAAQQRQEKRQSQTMSSSSTSAATKSFTPINNIMSQGNQSSTCVDYSNSYFNSEYGSGHSAKHVIENNSSGGGRNKNDTPVSMGAENTRPTSIPIIQQGGQMSSGSARPSAFSNSPSTASANTTSTKSKVKVR